MQTQSLPRKDRQIIEEDGQQQLHRFSFLPRLLQPLLVQTGKSSLGQAGQKAGLGVVLGVDAADGSTDWAFGLPLQRPHQTEPAKTVPAWRGHGFAQQA